ncbi:hypothetical protein V493_04679 [Pseudogymnoascus sp. VKM F-4281 (FW-2241)]|nr:hypothetical protein V493_04679 [Pseudogymnoascus sp. VKM F-4281 (FW-2241)]
MKRLLSSRSLSQLQSPTRTLANPYICTSCLQSRRARFSTSPRHNANPPPPPQSSYALLPSRRLISLSGPDAPHFLQGVITANIAPSTQSTPRTSGFYAAFLNAPGRVLYDVFIYPDSNNLLKGKHDGSGGENWIVEVDARGAETLYKHLKRFRLRSKFDIRLLPEDEMQAWSLWKEDKSKEVGKGWTPHTIPTSSEAVPAPADHIECIDNRAPGMGKRLLLPGGSKPPAKDTEGLVEADEMSYTIRRYLKGVAEGQDEILRESALPQESNIDYMSGIDYRKGCYVGQELTIRTHHTGVVRKRILPVQLYGAKEEEPKALEYKPEVEIEGPPAETQIGRFEKRGRSAGKWLKGVGNVGLALCRLEIMTNAMQGEGAGYKEGDEFKFEWKAEDGAENLVKVKAFVPAWHLSK